MACSQNLTTIVIKVFREEELRVGMNFTTRPQEHIILIQLLDQWPRIRGGKQEDGMLMIVYVTGS